MLLLFVWFALVSSTLIPPQVVFNIEDHGKSFSPSLSHIINRDDFNSWLKAQPDLSLFHILQNVGGSPLNSHLQEGVVVASPSNHKPDYYYQWIRDSALTINSLVTYLNDVGYKNATIAQTVEHYINNNYILQRVPNPSGDFDNNGLGEPKFHVDNTAFTDNWGRPQNDGPALRSITIMNYLNLVKKYNNSLLLLGGLENIHFETAADIYYDIVKPDLNYIVNNWNKIGFDLWEENKGYHFFTSLVQLKALKKGVIAAKFFQDHIYAKALRKAAVKIQHFIDFEAHYIDDGLHRIYESPQSNHKYGLDIATIIGSLITHGHSNDIDNNEGFEMPYDVDDSYVLNSLYGFIKDQKQRYPINHGKDLPGISLGRYPNDVYDGVGTSLGNPWFLSNAYASLFFYKKIYKLYSSQLDLVIFKETYNFYNEFIFDLGLVEKDYLSKSFIVVPFNSELHNTISQKLFSFGDSFLRIVLSHITDNGELSEQFNRNTGFSEGAANLTWSYSSVWGAIRERTLAEKIGFQSLS